jgi:GNAT superfamily N-acetyltransferase
MRCVIVTAAQVRAAHGDAWDAEGTLRLPYGGGVTLVRGARLTASGIDHPQWNNGDVDDPASADVEAMREWYAGLGVPWGVRVPAGAAWPHGRFLFRKRLMGLALDGFGRPPSNSLLCDQNRGVREVEIRRAGPDDLHAVVHIDSIGFEATDAGLERQWIRPHLDAEQVDVALAELDGEPVGTAYALRSDGRAGPALYVAGVTVLPAARRRGIASAVTEWLLDRGAAAGAQLAHLHPDSDDAGRLYARLGFVEVDGLDIYVDL